MSNLCKNFIFNNFTFTEPQNNKLKIANHSNIALKRNYITSCFGTSDLFENLFDESTYQILKEKYSDFFNSIIRIINYNYYLSSTYESHNRLFVLTNDLKLYEFIPSTNSFDYLNIQFDKFPIIIIENNTLFLHKTDNTSVLIEMNGIPVTVLNSCPVLSYEIYRSRLLFVNKNLPYTVFLTFSPVLYTLSSNINYYGKFNFNSEYGRILKLIYYKNKLYVFQQYKISCCSALLNDSIYFNEAASLNNKIIEGTIFHINDNIVFLTNSGLFCYDGNDLTKMFEDTTDKIILSDNVKAVVYENEYYLVCALKENPNKNVLIKFNIENEQTEIFSDYSINDIYDLKLDNKYLLCVNASDTTNPNIIIDKNKTSNKPKLIAFEKTNFNISNFKQLQDIKILGEGEFFVEIKSDVQKYKFKTVANVSVCNLNIKGNVFEFSIYSTNNFRIDSLIINILEIGEQ